MKKPILKENHTAANVKQYQKDLEVWERLNKINIPQPLNNPDFSDLIATCNDLVNYINSEDYHEDNDYKHFIYESALNAIFGENFWKFKNNRT